MSSLLSPSDDVMSRMQDRYDKIKKNGSFQPGVLNELDLNNLPKWMIREKLLKAQATARSYYMR